MCRTLQMIVTMTMKSMIIFEVTNQHRTCFSLSLFCLLFFESIFNVYASFCFLFLRASQVHCVVLWMPTIFQTQERKKLFCSFESMKGKKFLFRKAQNYWPAKQKQRRWILVKKSRRNVKEREREKTLCQNQTKMEYFWSLACDSICVSVRRSV